VIKHNQLHTLGAPHYKVNLTIFEKIEGF